MRCIHFILPNITEKGQATTPKQANIPHYQTSLFHIQSQVDSFWASGGHTEFKIYQPDQNYSNEFLHVTNLGIRGLWGLSWDDLAQLAYKELKGDEKRQRKFRGADKNDYEPFGKYTTTLTTVDFDLEFPYNFQVSFLLHNCFIL